MTTHKSKTGSHSHSRAADGPWVTIDGSSTIHWFRSVCGKKHAWAKRHPAAATLYQMSETDAMPPQSLLNNSPSFQVAEDHHPSACISQHEGVESGFGILMQSSTSFAEVPSSKSTTLFVKASTGAQDGAFWVHDAKLEEIKSHPSLQWPVWNFPQRRESLSPWSSLLMAGVCRRSWTKRATFCMPYCSNLPPAELPRSVDRGV